MILRGYQEQLIGKAQKALKQKQNTLAVAATGSGKTIMLSDLCGKLGGKTLILQHRDELVAQNIDKFTMMNPHTSTSIFNAQEKDFHGQTTFAMVQSLARQPNKIPHIDHMVIDEAHHSTAPTYMRLIEAAKEKNPNLILSGWTATPARSDGFGLVRAGFDNCCDEITIDDLVKLGYLVPPKAYVCMLEGVDLSEISIKRNGEYDMEEVEEVLDVEVHNRTIVEKWQELAGDRKTIVFCSTVDHAFHVTEAFQDAGIVAALLTGETPKKERRDMLYNFDRGNIQVICNVAVLTEGYDSQPVSCVVLLRPCSYKSTMLQMVGRGLRIVDPEEYPGVEKEDCLVLDFGDTLKTSGGLHLRPQLEDREKRCPKCESMVPPGTSTCQICGYVWEPPGPGGDHEPEEVETVTNVEMVEMDILRQSPFRWVDLFGSGKAMIAKGFDAMTGVFSPDGEKYLAIGKLDRERKMRVLQRGPKPQCLSKADDFLRMNEAGDAAKKSKRWLRDPATNKQWALLQRAGYKHDPFSLSMTKYTANCHLAFQWNRQKIENALLV
jgi:DNA repair protein RadD